MKLLITTLTMMFINFKTLGNDFKHPIESIDAKACFYALMDGELISYNPSKELYTYKYLNNIYNFNSLFTSDDYILSNCKRFKLK